MGCVGGRSWFAKSEADLYASSASDALALRSSADWNSARYLYMARSACRKPETFRELCQREWTQQLREASTRGKRVRFQRMRMRASLAKT